jgi:hypothetical protein
MLQTNFEHSDNFLNIKSYIIIHAMQSVCLFLLQIKMANIYYIHIYQFYVEIIKSDRVERLSNDLKAKQNIHYIQFIIHRKQHCVLWCEALFPYDQRNISGSKIYKTKF